MFQKNPKSKRTWESALWLFNSVAVFHVHRGVHVPVYKLRAWTFWTGYFEVVEKSPLCGPWRKPWVAALPQVTMWGCVRAGLLPRLASFHPPRLPVSLRRKVRAAELCPSTGALAVLPVCWQGPWGVRKGWSCTAGRAVKALQWRAGGVAWEWKACPGVPSSIPHSSLLHSSQMSARNLPRRSSCLMLKRGNTESSWGFKSGGLMQFLPFGNTSSVELISCHRQGLKNHPRIFLFAWVKDGTLCGLSVVLKLAGSLVLNHIS